MDSQIDAIYQGDMQYLRNALNVRRSHRLYSQDGRTLLHHAALANRKKAISLLVELGGDPDAQDVNGWTPLHIAVAHHCFQAAEELLKLGARTDIKSYTNCTASQLTPWGGCKQTAALINQHEISRLSFDKCHGL